MAQNDLTDFTDMSDVSDDALEWVIRSIPACLANNYVWDVAEIRDDAKDEYSTGARAMIITARLIQQHRPNLLVDPVDAIVREELAKAYDAKLDTINAELVRRGRTDKGACFAAAKRLYLMGKGEN